MKNNLIKKIAIGSLGITVGGHILSLIRLYIKKNYTFSINIDNKHIYYTDAYYTDIIKLIISLTNNKISSFVNLSAYSTNSKDLVYEIIEGSYVYKIDDKTLMFISSKGRRDSSANSLQITVVGKHYKKYEFIIKSRISRIFGSSNLLDITHISSRNNTHITMKIKPKSFNSIIGDEKYKIIEFIDNWRCKYSTIEKYEQSSSTGILLYGKGGTGKTSYIRAISSYLDAYIINFTPTVDNIDSNFELLIDLITDVRKKLTKDKIIMIVFEDVDLYTTDRTSEIENESTYNKQVITNKLMNIVDGLLDNDRILFIATTNYIENLDDAFIRHGRFDLKLEISYFNDKKYIKEMADFFNVDYNILIKNVENTMASENKLVEEGYPPSLVALECKKLL